MPACYEDPWIFVVRNVGWHADIMSIKRRPVPTLVVLPGAGTETETETEEPHMSDPKMSIEFCMQ